VTDEEPADDDESADEEPIQLSPEQRERLRETMERLRRSLAPKIDFNLGNPPGLSKIITEATTLSRLAAEAMKPSRAVQEALAKQAISQAQFAKLSLQLTKTVNFGLSETVAKIAQQHAARQATWLKSLGPTLARLSASFYPPNLRAIEGLRFEGVEKVVMADGIALYGVPRTAIADALIRAESAARRREILGRRWTAISADCRTAVTACDAEEVGAYVPIAVAALDALDDGHTAAAQALVGSLLDSLVNTYFGRDRYRFTPNKKNTTTVAYEEFTIREFVAFAPIWQAWQQFYPDKNDPIPGTFSRNATAHTVSSRQFNRRNAVQGLLLACSLIYFLDEQALARAA
jgi:hypothetical protein